MPTSRYRRHEPVAAVKSRTAPTRADRMPSGLADVPLRLAYEATRRPPPTRARTTRSSVLSFFSSMRCLPFECVRSVGQLATHDLVDELAGLREPRIDPVSYTHLTLPTNREV